MIKAAGSLALAAAILVPIGTTTANWRDEASVTTDIPATIIQVGHLNLDNSAVKWQIVNTATGALISPAPAAGGYNVGKVTTDARLATGQTLKLYADVAPNYAGDGMATEFNFFCTYPKIPQELLDLKNAAGQARPVIAEVYLNNVRIECKGKEVPANPNPLPSTSQSVRLELRVPVDAKLPEQLPSIYQQSKTVPLEGFYATLTQVGP